MPRLIYRLLLTLGAALIFRFSLPHFGIYITYAQAIIATIVVQVWFVPTIYNISRLQ